MGELTRGRLKLFLGYASGVDKSLRMLDEGRRRRERGQDVVVGALQSDLPADVADLVRSLEIITAIELNGASVVDVPCILRRAPQVCLVDELAFGNPAGSRNAHRWQDVQELLSAGITVVGSVNLQSIDDQREAVERITGSRVEQTVPRSFFNTADEIVMVDVSVQTASEQDGKLREMALLLSADVIDAGLQRYTESHGGEPVRGTQERLLICLTPGVNASRMVASALRSAARFHCEVLAVYVKQQLSRGESRLMEQSLLQARAAGARVHMLEGNDLVQTLMHYAHVNGITQIFIGHSTKTGWHTQLLGSAASRLVRAARGMDVRIFPVLAPYKMSHLSKGRLKIYIGYAPGVGKTYQMLADARHLKLNGVDVVIGIVETHGRSDVVNSQSGLEIVAPLHIPQRTGLSDELDLSAVLARRPQLCVVDELAHSSASSSARPKRWGDVQTLREAGIDVLTTMDVQNLSSLTDQIWHLTGLRVRETVPDWVFQEAEDVVIVDVTPRALIHRLQRGVIYSQAEITPAVSALFEEPTLDALRELAIRQTAQALEARQRSKSAVTNARSERILIHVTAHSGTAVLLRRARRIADFLHGECVAVCVHPQRHFSNVPVLERQAIERHLRFAENLQIRTVLVAGRNPARTLVEYSRTNGVTQIFVQGNIDRPRRFFPGLQFVDQLIQKGRELEITVVAEPSHEGLAPSTYPEFEAGALMHSGYVRLSPELKVNEALAEIRRQASAIEMIHYAYILDQSDHLLGVASFRDLLSADRSRNLRDVMRTTCLYVSETADQQAIAELSAKHRLLAVPVVDSGGRMKGIVNSVDIAALVQQAASEDIQKIGGMEALDGAYLDVTFAQMVRKRAGWLAVLFLGEMLTATAMSYFSDEISKAVVLALFLPLIISSGGNSGSQATTLVIRAMALGEIKLRDWPRVVGRELRTGLALGVFLGIIGIARILLWQATKRTYGPHFGLIAITIGCSLVGVVLFGTLAGSTLPFLLRRCGLDPASASAPFVATLVDVTGLIIYFTVANYILRGSLL